MLKSLAAHSGLSDGLCRFRRLRERLAGGIALSPLIFSAVLSFSVPAESADAAQPRDYGCQEWRHCHELALAARARGEYETFHDLAWRAVQTGPPKDPALMYLLARAQSLSGRPRDALILLDRLAAIGVGSEAATNDDFSRTRRLPGWSEVAARLEALTQPLPSLIPDAPPSSNVAATTPTAVSTAAPILAPPALRMQPVKTIQFAMNPFSVSGLAFDAVSDRFLFGDRFGRRLIVVNERSNVAMDLARADSAGFHDIAAMEVDTKRGDLWVASTTGTASRLHRLHLASGRSLRMFDVSPDNAPINLIDLSVGPDGVVLVLDAARPQLLILHPGAASLESVVILDVEDVSSVAAGGDAGTAYVAYRNGLIRIDLRAHRVTRLGMPVTLSAGRIERLRWSAGMLIAVTVDSTGARRIHRLGLDARGTAITESATGASFEPGQEVFVSVVGDELLYVLDHSSGRGDSPPGDTPARPAEIVTYRVRLP